ncbi:hypothetical protein BS47DRAFT_257850 [Hydnum rufescens UP504]|uniref:Uncharacterized protein n=1 Tax=Hydnum rufescens UP504 TaxID=1448309 RepID=A0A9P6B6M8_9AGAM|nr:hypothetical protein BS47DRAFT_257850 [Hydnum rufescens UP504]
MRIVSLTHWLQRLPVPTRIFLPHSLLCMKGTSPGCSSWGTHVLSVDIASRAGFRERRGRSRLTVCVRRSNHCHHGGFGFSEPYIGVRMSLRGMMGVATMLVFATIHKFIRHSSAVRLYKYAMAIWLFSVLPFPVLNFLARREGGPSGRVFELAFFCFLLLWYFSGFTWT